MLFVAAAGLTSIEPQTGRIEHTYKACEPEKGAVALTPLGTLVAQKDKPLIHQYTTKESVTKKIVVPEKLASLRASPAGRWLAAGTKSGRLLLWSLQSGALVAAVDAHFQALTHLQFTADEGALVSAGADARVLIWRLGDLIAEGDTTPEAVHVLTAHSLAITGLQVGAGSVREARIFSASKDATVCVFALHSGQLLQTLVLPAELTALAIDPAERAIYAGTATGVRVVPLYNVSKATGRLESLSSAGAIVSCDNATLLAGGAVSAMVLSDDATTLTVGDEQGELVAWDVGTNQQVHKYKGYKSPIGSLVFGDEVAGEVPALSRTLTDADAILSPGRLPELPARSSAQAVASLFSASAPAVPVSAPSDSASSAASAERVEELEKTARQYEQLKKMYDELWARHVKKT